MERKSSSSASTPFPMKPPLLSSIGASFLRVLAIFSTNAGQSSSCCDSLRTTSASASRHDCLISRTACSERAICNSSRGLALPTATLETSRSKSPTSRSCAVMFSRRNSCWARTPTVCSRSSICPLSFNGSISQRFNRREPIGVSVLSITEQSVFASG